MRLLPERRRHWRLVTLRNAAWLLGGLIVLFIAVSAWNELRPPDRSGERLYQRGSGDTPPAAPPRAEKVVEDQPVSDQTFTLRGASGELALAPAPAPAPSAAPAERPRRTTLKEAKERGQRIVITSDADGVRVDVTPASATTTQTAAPPGLF